MGLDSSHMEPVGANPESYRKFSTRPPLALHVSIPPRGWTPTPGTSLTFRSRVRASLQIAPAAARVKIQRPLGLSSATTLT